MGAGFATVIPQVFGAAGHLGGSRPGTALATVTTLGSSFSSWLMTNRNNADWRMYLGPGSSTSNIDEGLFYGLGGTSTQDVRLQIDVWKP